MSTPDSDAELSIALAEYAHIRELRHHNDEKASSRFNFFLALATAVTAVSAGLLSAGWQDSTTVAAVTALGFMLLVFGCSVFLRQVAFTSYGRRLTSAENAMRTYLARRAPGVAPYMFLPVGSDRGVFPRREAPFGGFAGAIGILNSTVLALAVGLYFGLDEFGAGAGVAAAIAFAGSLSAHLAYIHRSRRTSAGALTAVEKARGIIDEAE